MYQFVIGEIKFGKYARKRVPPLVNCKFNKRKSCVSCECTASTFCFYSKVQGYHTMNTKPFGLIHTSEKNWLANDKLGTNMIRRLWRPRKRLVVKFRFLATCLVQYCPVVLFSFGGVEVSGVQ